MLDRRRSWRCTPSHRRAPCRGWPMQVSRRATFGGAVADQQLHVVRVLSQDFRISSMLRGLRPSLTPKSAAAPWAANITDVTAHQTADSHNRPPDSWACDSADRCLNLPADLFQGYPQLPSCGFPGGQWSPNRNASTTRRRPEVTWSASWSSDDENTICCAACRTVTLIAEFGETQLSAFELLDIEVYRHREAAVRRWIDIVAVTVKLASALALIATDSQPFPAGDRGTGKPWLSPAAGAARYAGAAMSWCLCRRSSGPRDRRGHVLECASCSLCRCSRCRRPAA